MITKATLTDFFDDLKSKGDFDATKPLLYGYFFTDENQEKLLEAKKVLQKDGYTFVDIFEAENEENVPTYFYLHIEKIEIHDVASLHKRNTAFYLFAEKYNLNSYDGFDIGNVE